MPDVVAELDDALRRRSAEVCYQALREIPRLEAALKETLRLHPPLIILLRVVQEEIEVGRPHIPPGTMVGGQPAGVEPDRRGLPRPRARSTPAATSTRAQEDLQQPLDAGSRSAPGGTAASATRSR